MPRLTRPPKMPREVEVAIELIGNRARADIVRALSTHTTLTIPEIADIIGATRPAVLGHLNRLEERGLVEADTPSGQRRGRVVHWRVVPAEVERVGTAFLDYLAGR